MPSSEQAAQSPAEPKRPTFFDFRSSLGSRPNFGLERQRHRPLQVHKLPDPTNAAECRGKDWSHKAPRVWKRFGQAKHENENNENDVVTSVLWSRVCARDRSAVSNRRDLTGRNVSPPFCWPPQSVGSQVLKSASLFSKAHTCLQERQNHQGEPEQSMVNLLEQLL